MPDINYANDLVLLTYTSAEVGSLLHCLEQAIGGIGIYVNANETELMCS